MILEFGLHIKIRSCISRERLLKIQKAGRKVLRVQGLPAWDEQEEPLASAGGFSLHAGVAVKTRERGKLEKLCRHITRPSLSEKRLEQMDDGRICYKLKTPYRDGSTEVIYEPLDFIAKLAALVPKPRVNLTRYHGVLAPNSANRGRVVPSGRGRLGGSKTASIDGQRKRPRKQLGWAGRLKRVFNIDVSSCADCGGEARGVAQIDDPKVIEKILSHLLRLEQGIRVGSGQFRQNTGQPSINDENSLRLVSGKT